MIVINVKFLSEIVCDYDDDDDDDVIDLVNVCIC